jgi:hypothetical protein
MQRPTGWLLILCWLLCIWDPLNLAWSASSSLATLPIDRLGRLVFLILEVLVAGVGVAAGIAIWSRQMHGLVLAKIALGLSAATALIRFVWFPGNVPPDLRVPLGVFFVAYNAAWYAYLIFSREAKLTTQG